MELKDIINEDDERQPSSIPANRAIEAAAKAFADPAIHATLVAQSRLATEAITSMIKSPDVQSTLASIVAHTSFAATKQLAELITENRSCWATQMASIVTEMRSPTFPRAGESLLKRHEERIQELASIMRPSRFANDVFASLNRPYLPEYRAPLYIPPTDEPRETAAEEFMRRLKEHVEAAEEQIADSGGRLVVVCKAPGGDEVFVQQVSNKDEHFIRVIGIDIHRRVREFTGHHSSIGITVEVMIEDVEALETDDEAIN